MKRKYILVFVVLLLVGIANAKSKKQTAPQTPIVEQPAKPATIVEAFGKLAQNLVAQANNKPTFAFMALNSDDGNALVENYVTDALTEAMFATGKIKVVERTSLEKIMSEQQFQSSALVNENTAAEIGNLSGADFVCYGTIKDLKSQISVSVRVVEVSTAELYAMNRDSVEKDAYLANVGFEKRKESAPLAGIAKTGNSEKAAAAAANMPAAPASTAETSASAKPRVNSVWEVIQKDNVYTFICKGSDEPFLFVGYEKNANAAKSLVKAGIYWRNYNVSSTKGDYDIKEESGDVTKKNYYVARWKYQMGWGGEFDGSQFDRNHTSGLSSGEFIFCYNKSESARFFVEMFGKNKFITVRHDDENFRFMTEGFWQTVEEQGLTREEIYDAIANEEF